MGGEEIGDKVDGDNPTLEGKSRDKHLTESERLTLGLAQGKTGSQLRYEEAQRRAEQPDTNEIYNRGQRRSI